MFALRNDTAGSVGERKKCVATERSIRDFLPAFCLLFTGLIGLSAAALSAPEQAGRYVVIAPPWSGLDETLAMIGLAEGGLIDLGGFHNIVLVASSHPDFRERVEAAGAWFVLPSPRLPTCFTAEETS